MNARLQLAIDVAQLGTWGWDLRSGDVTWSDRFCSLFGYSPGEVAPSLEAWHDRLHPDDAMLVKEQLLGAVGSGAAYHQVYRIRHSDGTVVWCEARGRQEADAEGLPRRMMGVAIDITEHKAAEERQRLMLQELHHRVKNSLATVQAIAGLTARTAPSIDAFHVAFNNRIRSLGRTHTMLVSGNWQCINIEELLRSELGGFADDRTQRLIYAGPAVELPSEIALSLGLAFHELATNAAKYGALSVPDGRVSVSWSLLDDAPEDRRRLELRWIEQGGPPVKTPEREGFGSTLLQKVFAVQDGSTAELRYCEDGVRFRAVVPCMTNQVALNRAGQA